MFYRKITKVIFLMLMISTLATANDAKARAYYLGAQEAYDAQNYSAALFGLVKTKELLGGSNAAISALETKIYYKQGKYKKAKESIDFFLSQKSSPDLFKEMSSYLIKIDEGIKLEQCKCVLLEKYDLIMDFTKFNESDHYLVGSSFASDKTYFQSHNCGDIAQENSKDFYCIGDEDSGNFSVKIYEEGYKVKFENQLRLDGDYNIELGEPTGKEITFEETDYIYGKCVPCP